MAIATRVAPAWLASVPIGGRPAAPRTMTAISPLRCSILWPRRNWSSDHRGYEPPEGWGWRYFDEVMIDLDADTTPRDGRSRAAIDARLPGVMWRNVAYPSCDRAIASTQAGPAAPTTRPALVLATCILASSLAFVDGSVINVALPTIGTALKTDGGGLAWVVNAYLLPLSALLLIGGAAGIAMAAGACLSRVRCCSRFRRCSARRHHRLRS